MIFWTKAFKIADPFFKREYLFLIATRFCTYGYLFGFIFVLLTFGDKGVRVLAGPFLRLKILWYVRIFQWVQNYSFPKENCIFPNSLINSWNLRKWNISFIMLSLKCGWRCVNSPHFIFNGKFHHFIYRFKNWDLWIFVLDCTAKFFPIHKEIENCDVWMLL